jgi:hypothetical protein
MLDDHIDYELWHGAIVHWFKANMNRKVYDDVDRIPDCTSIFTYNRCTLTKSKPRVPNPVVSKSRDMFEVIYIDICRPFPNESHSSSKYFLTIIDDFSRFF